MKDDLVFIKHIRDAIYRIERYMGAVSYEQFSHEQLIQDAVIRQFMIIGEAAKLVSEGIKERYSDVPWKDMTGMRDKLIHGYFSVDIETVWQTVQEDLPELKQGIERLLDYEANSEN